jgi:uncharacterized protein YgiM (DUF1202 family)
MIARLLASTCLIAIAASAYGQGAPAAQPAGEAASAGWVGVLTGTNVYVRCGPGENAYPCTQLSAPQKVTVVGRSEGWLKILPPPGCYSVIGKSYVQADETGKTGVVNTDNIRVRAGGDLRTTDFWEIQCRTGSGDKVEIIGETGDYYKITPPPGAYFWISARYVRPADEAQPSELEVASGATRPGAATKPVELTVVPQKARLPTTVPTELPKAPSESATESFRAAERALREEFAKPLEQRDLKGLLARYQAIQAPADSRLGKYVDVRVKFLRDAIGELKELDSVREMAKATEQQQKEYEARRAELQKQAPPPEPVRTFAAKGVLAESEVFPGGAVGPKRYILIDPQTRQVAAYVQCGTGAVDLSQYAGMVIGVFGQKHLDRQLLRYVVEAEEVVVMEASGQIPTPPKPVIRIRQYPEPQAPAEKEKPKAAQEEQPAPAEEPSSEGLPVVQEEQPQTQPQEQPQEQPQ